MHGQIFLIQHKDKWLYADPYVLFPISKHSSEEYSFHAHNHAVVCTFSHYAFQSKFFSKKILLGKNISLEILLLYERRRLLSFLGLHLVCWRLIKRETNWFPCVSDGAWISWHFLFILFPRVNNLIFCIICVHNLLFYTQFNENIVHNGAKISRINSTVSVLPRLYCHKLSNIYLLRYILYCCWSNKVHEHIRSCFWVSFSFFKVIFFRLYAYMRMSEQESI